MAKQREQRWYEIWDGLAHVYDAPFPDRALGESIVPVHDLAYYRANFVLEKIWAPAAQLIKGANSGHHHRSC